jgi:hypothetical protein
LAGGIAALALIALSVAALPICSGKLFSFLSYFRVYQFKFYFFYSIVASPKQI